jgi:uncharacterized protein YihD (DUF1040 family)
MTIKQRDPERIPVMLELIKTLWERNPDWRFMQLALNLNENPLKGEGFYQEDDKTEQILIQQINRSKF